MKTVFPISYGLLRPKRNQLSMMDETILKIPLWVLALRGLAAKNIRLNSMRIYYIRLAKTNMFIEGYLLSPALRLYTSQIPSDRAIFLNQRRDTCEGEESAIKDPVWLNPKSFFYFPPTRFARVGPPDLEVRAFHIILREVWPYFAVVFGSHQDNRRFQGLWPVRIAVIYLIGIISQIQGKRPRCLIIKGNSNILASNGSHAYGFYFLNRFFDVRRAVGIDQKFRGKVVIFKIQAQAYC